MRMPLGGAGQNKERRPGARAIEDRHDALELPVEGARKRGAVDGRDLLDVVIPILEVYAREVVHGAHSVSSTLSVATHS